MKTKVQVIGGELVELVEDIMTLAKNIEMLDPNDISQHCQELSRRCHGYCCFISILSWYDF